MGKVTNRLSEEEVRGRLKICTDAQVIDEIYTFGQMMLRETVASTRLLDTKAASLATYGAAILTLLVSTSGTWSALGNHLTLAVAAFAGVAAFVAAVFAVKALALRKFEWLGEQEWLHEECLSGIDKLKKYRVLTIWGAMDSHKSVHLEKVRLLQKAQSFLSASVFILLLTLLHIAWLHTFHEVFWRAAWKIIHAGPIIQEHYLWATARQFILGLRFLA